jgi:hypothetical protein
LNNTEKHVIYITLFKLHKSSVKYKKIIPFTF